MVAVIRRVAQQLADAGVDSPRADAEQLVAYVLGIPRGRLVLAGGLTAAQRSEVDRLAAARAERVPLQHLTGTVGFCRLELAVGPGVFIPRPETELLAQWAVGVARSLPQATVVDLGSGTGALALTIAHELRAGPPVRVYAVERSVRALRWLRRNVADRAAAGDPPVRVVIGDALDPVILSELDGMVDLLVSNPPYVPEGVPVPPEVARHDPPEAVFAGPDGLAVIRPLIARAATLLRPGGWLGFEYDPSQEAALPPLLAPWFESVEQHRDLTGRPRYLTARRVAD